ncbi:MAG: VOC family protein [Candidatus Methylomirabilia bacterium]
MKKRTGDPWIPADRYGRLLPALTVNLLVRSVSESVTFYTDVLGATIHYADPDFAALKVGGAELMLHADHTYDKHPWYPRLTGGERRGLGAELRFLGVDPDLVGARAHEAGAPIVQPATTKGHGWREVMVEDPDGYVWDVGVVSPKSKAG